MSVMELTAFRAFTKHTPFKTSKNIPLASLAAQFATNKSTNQHKKITSTHQPSTIHQHINTPTHQHINISTHQHINTSIHQHINTSTDQHLNTSTHQSTHVDKGYGWGVGSLATSDNTKNPKIPSKMKEKLEILAENQQNRTK
jgi:hypothetical protein